MKKILIVVGFALIGTFGVRAQYPRIAQDIAAQAKARQSAADERSDAAFQKALPTIKEWEAKGKPYLPGAAKPSDLPQAKVPAFPGAWGGGYLFDLMGSYDLAWKIGVFIGLIAGTLQLLMNDRPTARHRLALGHLLCGRGAGHLYVRRQVQSHPQAESGRPGPGCS